MRNGKELEPERTKKEGGGVNKQSGGDKRAGTGRMDKTQQQHWARGIDEI